MDFLLLSSPFHIANSCHFETRPSPFSKREKMHAGAHYLQLCRTTVSTVTPIFLFRDFNKNSASF